MIGVEPHHARLVIEYIRSSHARSLSACSAPKRKATISFASLSVKGSPPEASGDDSEIQPVLVPPHASCHGNYAFLHQDSEALSEKRVELFLAIS